MSMTTTSVAIVGAGPAGLMVSHLLAREGVESVVVDSRSRETIATTHRAGILEAGSVQLLVDGGVSDRVLTEGHEHEGIELRFDGHGHRVDFQDLVGRSVWLYPQTSVFADLAARREADGGDVRWSVTDTAVSDVTGRPTLTFTDADGVAQEVSARYLVGADGSHSICRRAVPQDRRQAFYREYPFAWFGVLVEAPPSAPELVYASSPRGFALVSQRTESVQRMYFQCDLDEDPAAWSDDRIWDELQTRVAGDGLSLNEGPVVERSVLQFRSFVHEPMRHGNLLLAGDAAHTVPPTGAKGLNLALHDARLLAERLADALRHGRPEVLDGYTEAALDRVWRAQHFSSWLTTLLHTAPGATEFDDRRRRAELTSLVTSRHGSAFLAEGYTGWSPATETSAVQRSGMRAASVTGQRPTDRR